MHDRVHLWSCPGARQVAGVMSVGRQEGPEPPREQGMERKGTGNSGETHENPVETHGNPLETHENPWKFVWQKSINSLSIPINTHENPWNLHLDLTYHVDWLGSLSAHCIYSPGNVLTVVLHVAQWTWHEPWYPQPCCSMQFLNKQAATGQKESASHKSSCI